MYHRGSNLQMQNGGIILQMKETKLYMIVTQLAGKFIFAGEGRHITRVHDWDELIVVLQGELEMFEEDSKFRVRAGEWLLLQRGKQHGGLAPYPANLSFFWLHFRDDGTVIGKLPQHGILREPANFSVHMQSFLNEQNRLDPDKKIMELLFLLMVQEMHRPSQEQLKVELATPLAIAAQKYIGTHFNEQLSLESIAEELHCNPQYLSRLYRKAFGITLTEELNKRRIARAKWLLACGSLSIKETAKKCGFNDLAYFRRQFRRYCSMTPNEYRSRHLPGFWNTQ